MKEKILITLIIACAIVSAGYLVGGRYTILLVDSSDISTGVYRIDRYTGKLWMCAVAEGGIQCVPGADFETLPKSNKLSPSKK
jgi:hypothetical protein